MLTVIDHTAMKKIAVFWNVAEIAAVPDTRKHERSSYSHEKEQR